jgi:hypothetical protein
LVCFAIAVLLTGYNVRLRQASARISVPVGQVSETAVSASKPTSLPAWGRLEIERIVLERPDTLLRNVEGY